MSDQTPNKSCGRCLLEKNWGKGQCKHFREWQSMQGPGFVINPKVVIQKLLVTAGSQRHSLTKKDETAKPEHGSNEKCLGVGRAPLSYGNSCEEKNDCVDLRLQLRLWQMGFTTRSWYLKSLDFSRMALWAPHLCAQARFPHCPALLLILDLGCHWKLSAEKRNGRCRSWNNLSHIL